MGLGNTINNTLPSIIDKDNFRSAHPMYSRFGSDDASLSSGDEDASWTPAKKTSPKRGRPKTKQMKQKTAWTKSNKKNHSRTKKKTTLRRATGRKAENPRPTILASEIHPSDVLLGCTTSQNNAYYRELVQKNVRRYREMEERAKRQFLHDHIISPIYEIGGRFLRKRIGGEYYIIAEERDVEKTIMQALRDQWKRLMREGSGSQAPTSCSIVHKTPAEVWAPPTVLKESCSDLSGISILLDTLRDKYEDVIQLMEEQECRVQTQEWLFRNHTHSQSV